MIKYSIIIVNYKSPALVIDCLDTLFSRKRDHFEVIVVDNNSQDQSRSLILAKHPSVRWIQMDYNSGFARGNNEGIKAAKGETVLLLNSDTLIKDDAIDQCYARLQQSDWIAAGVQLLNPDGSAQISGNFFMKGGLNHLMNLPVTGSIIRQIGLMLKVKKTHVPDARGAVEVDWINGAFLMVKKSAIQKAGMLDEDFFLFSEEIEWCYRLGRVGKMGIFGDLHVVHLMGATATDAFKTKNSGYKILSDRKGLQLMLSGFVRIRKQFGKAWFLLHWVMHWATIPVAFIYTLFAGIVLPRSFRERWSSFFGFSGNVAKASKYLFRILGNKPYFYKVL